MNLKRIIEYSLLICFSFILLSCEKGVGYKQIWREKHVFPDGSHVMIYHSNSCTKEKPFLLLKENIIDYRKFKNDVFDSCISQEDAILLNLISRRNINYCLDNFIFEEENDYRIYKELSKLFDCSNRMYETYYAYVKDDSLVRLKRPFRANDL